MRATRKLTLHKVLLVTSTLYLYLNTVHAGLFCPSYVGNYDYHFVLEIYDVPPECLENNNIIYSLDSAGVIKCSNNTECKTSTDVADSYEVWFKKLGRPNGLQYNLTYPSTANVTLPLGTYQTVWTCGRHQYNHSCTVRTGVEEDECDFCLHNTYCEDLPVGYQCLCEDGYSGINCSQGDQRLYCNYTDIFYSTYAHACSDPKALDCYVAGQTLSQPLQFNLDEVQFNVSFLMTNQSANISICVPESAVIGNYTFIGTIEAETREKFDLTFDVYLMSVFLNVPESGYYLFNVSEDVSVNDKVVNVSKTPCSDCIQIVDNKKTENIHFFDTVWDDAITLDKNTFIVTRPLKAPNVVMKKLKAAVGQLDYGSINVTFQVTDVDEPPSCNETEIDIEISLPGDSVDTLDVHLNCSDPDVEAKFKVINYSVDPNYESFFSVNEDGILRVTSSLAYLAPGLHHFNITLNKDYKDDRFRIILQISLTIRDPTQESGDTTVPTEQDDTTETTEPMSTTTTVSDTLRNTTLFYYPTPSASRYITTATSANSTSFVTSNLFSTASTPSTPTFGSLSTVTSIGHNSTFASSGYLSTITSSRYVSTLTSSDYVGTLESTDYVATLASSFYVSALTSSNPLTSSDPVTKLTSSGYVSTLTSSGYVSTLTSSGYISTLTSSDYVSTPDSTNHASVTNTNTVLNTSVTTSGTTPTVSLGFTSQSEMITFPVSLSTAADSLSTHSPVDPFYITTKSEDSIMTNTLSNPVYTSKASEDSITTNSPNDIVYSSDSVMTNAPSDPVYSSDSIMTNAPSDPVYSSDSIMTNAPSDPVYSSNSKMTNAPTDPVYLSDSIMTNAPSDLVYSSNSKMTNAPTDPVYLSDSIMTNAPSDPVYSSNSKMTNAPTDLVYLSDSIMTNAPTDPVYLSDSIMTNAPSDPVYSSNFKMTNAPTDPVYLSDSIMTNAPSDPVYSSNSKMTNAPSDPVYSSDSIMTNAPSDPVYSSDSIMTNAPSDPVYSSDSIMTNAPSDPVYSSDSIMTNAPSDPVYSSTKLADSIRKTSSTISLSTLVASEAFSSLSSTNILSHTLTITFSSTSKSIDMLSTSATSFQLTTANFLSTTESTYFFSWSTQSTPTLTPEVSQISESPLITPTATVSLNSVYTTSSDSQMPSTLVVDPTSTPVVTSTLPPENCIPETVVLTQTLAQKNKTIYNISCSQSGVVGLELLSSGEAGDAVQLIGTSIFLSKELPNTLANFTIIVAVKFVGRSDNYSTTFLLACPETREPDGVIFSQAWPETLHTEACPTGYSGTISRWCTKDATWEPYNITSCTRGVDKALNMLDQLNSSSLNMSLVKEIIKLADPQKPVNNSEDFKNLLTILNRLSITFKDSDAPLDFDSFQQIANITDQLVSGDDNVWLNERSGQDQAAQLMESFERMATASLKSLNKTGEITLTTSKLGITLNVLAKNITYDSTQSQGWVNEAKNKISYDPLDAGSLNYSIILYRNLADHVRLNQSLQEKFEESKGLVNKTFNSYIISISVSQGQISKPISITFSLVQNNYSKPACGFLNTSNSLESFWSTSGCTVTAFSESQVTCTCNHLTNFAVLMSPFGNLIDTEALSYISIIGCSISLFCLTLTVIIYIVLWKYLKNDRSVLHLNLSVCLMIGYIVFLAGVRSTENRVGCIVVAALLHYFFLAVFFMMLAEGVEIIKSVSFVFTSRSIIGYLLLGAYGIPLIIVGVSLAVTQTKGYGNDKYCWLSTSSGLIWAFVGPVLLIFLANLIILIIVLRTMQTSRIIKDKSVPDRVKSAIRSICILSPILGLAWIFGVLSVNEASQVFTYLFAIFNSLQGLFIFIFQCLLQHQVKDAMKEKRRKYKVQNSVDSGQKLVSSNSSVRGTQSQSNTTTKSTSEDVFDYPLFPNAVYKDAKNESNTVYKDAKNGNKNEVTRGQDATEAANMAIKEDNYMNYDLAYAGTPYKNSDPMVFPNYGFSFSEMDLDDFKSNNQIVEIDGNSIRSKESWQARSRRRKQGLDENAEIEKERLKHVYGDVQAVRRLPQNSVPENSQLRAKERWKQLQLLAKSTQKSKDRDSIPETKEDIFMAPQLGALVDSYKHNNPKKSRPQLPPLVIPRPNAGHSLSPGYHSHI